MIGKGDLRHLQQTAFRAVVSGQLEEGTPLPRFPDFNYVAEADEMIVSTRNLADGLEGADRILTPEQIVELAMRRGEVPYLEFREPELTEEEGVVRLAVEICLGFAEVEPLRLGAIIFAFRRKPAGGWSVSERPRALAY